MGIAILMPGCSKNDDIPPKVLEQQRLNEIISKRNQDTLDKINQKEKEIARRQKEVRDALNKIEVKKKELTARENKLNEYAKDLSKREDSVKKLLEEEIKLANDIKNRSELDKKRALLLEELAVDWAKAAQNNPHLPETLETELEKELDVALSQNQSDSDIRAIYNKYYEMAGTLWYNNINNYLQQNDVIHIKSDEEFEKTAKEAVEKFMQFNTSPDDFAEIEKRYIDLQSAKK
jgi:chromosome segregation ATPase